MSEKEYSVLDRVRINEGINQCKQVFADACKKDLKSAADLVNDDRLSFPGLFIVLPQIRLLHLEQYLDLRNTTALGIMDQIRKREASIDDSDYLSDKRDIEYTTLKWMLTTGAAEDGLDDEYEEILDVAASVLINVYEDTSILPIVAELIFARSKMQHHIHDLVWALFASHDPAALKLIAQRILSDERQDVELAYDLLNIKADPTNSTAADHQKQYDAYIRWLDENDPFLFFTGESFQFSSRPVFCSIDLDRKYLRRGTSTYLKQPVNPADESERRRLQAFRSLTNEEKAILSEYSYRMGNRSRSEWIRWMTYPIKEQIRVAIAERERTNGYNI